ncbi:MAG: type II and III secretion system protein [Verrucomicrobia bacterium]|nr:type II and III secretion system protein [Verrucomicrobiota bacterium]
MKKLVVIGLVGISAAWLSARAQVVQQAQPLAAIQPQTTPVPLGPTLDVIPYVSADGYTIQMNLIPTLTEFLGYDDPGQFQAVVGSVAAPVPLPRFRVRQVTTTTIVWDGQTIVMGGLISERVTKNKDKVPVLGDLPLVGRLFRSEGKDSQKKNLLIFVTPTIIDPAGNRVNDPNKLPYDPNKIPAQVPFAPTGPAGGTNTVSSVAQ